MSTLRPTLRAITQKSRPARLRERRWLPRCLPLCLLPGASTSHAVLPDFTAQMAATDCNGPISYTQAPPAGALLEVGETTITFSATDAAGNAATCLTLVTVLQAPVLTTQPQGGSVELGVPVTLTAAATGTGPLSWQWWHEGTPLAGATDSTLQIAAATFADAGDYRVRVSNVAGTITSDAATLLVVDTTAPEITVCAPSQALAADATCQALVPDLTGRVIATDLSGSPFVTQNPPPGTLVNLGETMVTFTATDGAENTATCTTTLTLVDQTPPEITFVPAESGIAADDTCSAQMPDLTGLVMANECSGSQVVTQDPAPGESLEMGVTTVTLTATDPHGNAAVCETRVIVTDQTKPTLSVPADVAAVACEAIPEVGTATANDACDPALVATYLGEARTVADGGYTLTRTWQAQDTSGNTTTGQQTIVVTVSAPTVTGQPQDMTVEAGGEVTFSVLAESCEPLQFQWHFNDAPLEGETAATLTLASVQSANAGVYHVVVSNLGGSRASEAALLVVNEPEPLKPPVLAPVVASPGGAFKLQFTGSTNLNYFIEACASLGGSWSTLGAAQSVEGQLGNYRFEDELDNPQPSRLYRVRVERK